MDPSFRLRGSFETGDVTPVDLLSHRSGLADHAGDILEDLGFSRADIYARIRHHQTVPGSFRARYAYTNFGYSEPSFAVAKFRKPGISFEDQAARDFFGPAGMPSTSFKYSDLRGRSNRAFGHLLDPKTKKYVVASPQRNPDPQSPAGGASSSVRDLARWMLLHLGNGMLDGSRLVSAVSLGYTRSGLMRYVNGPIDKNPIAPTPQYGMGWIASIMPQSGMVKNTHSGAFILGTGTHVSIVPALQLGIVVVTNAQPVGLAEIVGSTFIDNVVYGAPLNNYEALFPPQFAELLTPLFGQNLTGPAPNPWRGNLTAFVGTYGNNSLYGTAEIARSGAGLVMKLGPPAKRMTFPLRGWDGPTFVYSTVGENGNGMPARVAFELRGGRAVKVVVENLERGLDPHFEPVGEGTFTRS
ncbi:penicillin binding protein [Hyaloraphidium curvatum]|nr:penicillin binding protein [Hyaloraphidium curvatum]